MNGHDSTERLRCPDCQATYPQAGNRCWLCGRALPDTAATTAATPPMIAQIIPAESPWTFSISSLMLVTMLAAVCLGLWAIAPGLAVVVSVVALPALARTFTASARRKARGERLTPLQNLATFAGSVAAVIVAGIAAILAFGVTCAVGLGAIETTGSVVPDVLMVVVLILFVIVPFVAGGAVFLQVLRRWPGGK